MMKISHRGIELIKRFEGCRLVPYKCVPTEEHYTVGYGHYGGDVVKGKRITQKKADELLDKDVQKFVDGVNKLLKVPVTQTQFDALVSFAFNCGLGSLKASTLLKLVNEKKYKLASLEFYKWNRAGGKVMEGLVKRREAEGKLFIEGM